MMFDGCETDLTSRDWSQELAWRFALMSQQAYRDYPLQSDGLRQFWNADGCERITRGSQSVLVIWDRSDLVLAFEGSNPSADDWRANADTTVGQMGPYFVHHGFCREYLKTASPLTELLNDRRLWPGRRLHVTGHSQGGAIAEIAACQRSATTCYTFGTPKTFSRRRQPEHLYPNPANQHPCRSAWYHWHSNDIVPHLPLRRRFQHRAKLCYVRQSKGAIPQPVFWQLLWLKAWSYRPGDTVKDHSISTYVEALTCQG